MDKKLSITMISGPQNDMRHTGHVGCDGTTFGDVAFIVDNFDKLPKKPQTPGESGSFPRPTAISPLIVISLAIFLVMLNAHLPTGSRQLAISPTAN